MPGTPGAGEDQTTLSPSTGAERSASLPFRVRFDEATPTGSLRTSVLLRYAADLAAFHSDLRGFGRAWYQERGLAWLVRGVELDVLGRVGYGQELIGTTEAIAARKVIARRRTEFRTTSGELTATLTVDWALTSAGGAPTRIPPIFATVFTMPEQTFAPIRVRSLPPDGVPIATLDLDVRPQELDPMGHVNNAVYADWADQAIRATGDAAGLAALDAVPRRWRLEYLGAAGPEGRVRAIAWAAGDGWSCRIVDARGGEPYLGASLEV
jgi:acyl-CoA thioesterase FadM